MIDLKNKNFFEASFKYASLVFGTVGMFLGSFRWIEDLDEVILGHSLSIIILSLPIAWYLKKVNSNLFAFIFLLVIGFIELPNLFVHGDLKIIGALYFLICRGMIAYLGLKTSNKNLFELSCIVISIRIIIIYFEVFGSLLQTGVGLISTGVFILLIAYVWHSRREKIWGLRKI